MHGIFSAILPALALSMVVQTAWTSVIITGGKQLTYVHNAGNAADNWEATSPSNSLHTTATATLNGNTSTTQYDYEIVGSSGYIQSTVTDAHNGLVYAPNPNISSWAHNYAVISFNVTDAPVAYSASGEFNLNGSGYVIFQSYLSGPSGQMFNYSGASNGVTNEQFTLGDAGGNLTGISTGSLSGILEVGSYQFFYDPMVRASDQYGAASATGFIRLEFGSPAPAAVPEPGSLALMGLGLAGLGLGLRRRPTNGRA